MSSVCQSVCLSSTCVSDSMSAVCLSVFYLCLILCLLSVCLCYGYLLFVITVSCSCGIYFSAGVLGTAKALISETSDDSNQAFGIAIVACAWGMGLVLGSAVSGAIADPIGQYNLNVSSKRVRCEDQNCITYTMYSSTACLP